MVVVGAAPWRALDARFSPCPAPIALGSVCLQVPCAGGEPYTLPIRPTPPAAHAPFRKWSRWLRFFPCVVSVGAPPLLIAFR